MDQRTVVITGASSGIGEAATRALAARGHRVVAIGRNPTRTAAVAAATGATPMVMDLADLASVRHAAAELLALPERIDVLALNAGAMFGQRRITRDGVEETFQTNHLGHFLLERRLHERLVEDRALVVFTCSIAAHLGRLRPVQPDRYRMFSAYGDSKLAGLLFVRELARRSRGTGLTAVAFHPGTVSTRFGSDVGGLFGLQMRAMRPVTSRTASVTGPDQGAATLVRLASVRAPRGLAAHYLGPSGRDAVLPRRALDRGLGDRLWSLSERLAGV